MLWNEKIELFYACDRSGIALIYNSNKNIRPKNENFFFLSYLNVVLGWTFDWA